jgi:hypothetical protein
MHGTKSAGEAPLRPAILPSVLDGVQRPLDGEMSQGRHDAVLQARLTA